MPALAACGAALLQAVIGPAQRPGATYGVQRGRCPCSPASRRWGCSWPCWAAGCMLAAVKDGYDLADRRPSRAAGGVPGQGQGPDSDACPQIWNEKDPWVLLSRPVQWDDGPAGTELWTSAPVSAAPSKNVVHPAGGWRCSAVWLCPAGRRRGVNGMAAAMTAMLCMGAPLSSTLVAGHGHPAAAKERRRCRVRSWCPAGPRFEELGGVDTVQVDADELFHRRQRGCWRTSASSRAAASTAPSSMRPAS